MRTCQGAEECTVREAAHTWMSERPSVHMLETLLSSVRSLAQGAQERGDWATAADYEERAAESAHRLGLLKDALVTLYLGLNTAAPETRSTINRRNGRLS